MEGAEVVSSTVVKREERMDTVIPEHITSFLHWVLDGEDGRLNGKHKSFERRF